MATLVTQGFKVKSATLTSKKDIVKLVLDCKKDELSAGARTLTDVLISLEFHATGADSSPAAVNLHGTEYDFSVEKFEVKQDLISLTLLGTSPETEDEVESRDHNGHILSAVAYHSATDTAVELVLAATD